MPNKPTSAEKARKLEEAKRALKGRDGLFANPPAVPPELEALGIGDSKDVWPLIRRLLEEIKPGHYAGQYPPMRSKLPQIQPHEMFAYSWDSQVLGNRMYIKFVIKNGFYFYVRLHVDRPEKKEG
jgi:hypothetical protein